MTSNYDVYENETTETGEQIYDDLLDAYEEGWNSACDDVFFSYYELYYGDNQYSYYDYYGYVEGEPEVEESFPGTDFPYISDDADEAYQQGREAALDVIFYDSDVLYYGTEEFSRYDF